jgi:hypothetical protein
MRAPVDNFRQPDAVSKLHKQAIAPMGLVQPTIVSEWLVWITFERFDEIPRTKVFSASILTDARISR